MPLEGSTEVTSVDKATGKGEWEGPGELLKTGFLIWVLGEYTSSIVTHLFKLEMKKHSTGFNF